MLKMKNRWFRFISVVLLASFVACQAKAVDRLESYKKAKEEFEQAERAISKKQTSSDSVQKELDRLTEQKALWEREIVFYRGKVANATSKLEAATASGAADEIDRWKRELAAMDSRVKKAEQELANIDEQTKSAIQSLQKKSQRELRQ